MNRIQIKMDRMNTTKTLTLALGIIVISVAGWLTFVLAAWNQNLLLTVLAMAIPAVLFRVSMGRKMSGLETLEMIVFGILLWNHLLAVIITLFIVKVVINKIRK